MQQKQLKKKICVLFMEFADFSLSKKTYTTILSCKAYTEVDFDRYVVLYSKNGIDFKEIISVNVKGNNYNYPNHGDAYFRLKVIKINGQFLYSKVLHSKGDSFAFKVGPNLFSDNLTLTGMQEDLNPISLYSLTGAGIITHTVNQSGGCTFFSHYFLGTLFAQD